MYVRLTFFKLNPDNIREAIDLYNKEVVPVVREQKGNIDIWILEPITKQEEYISITQWKSETDAEVYEKSGLYKNLISKFERYLIQPPVLKTYTAEKIWMPKATL